MADEKPQGENLKKGAPKAAGFDAKPPSRSDAKNIVEQRRAEQPKTRVTKVSSTKSPPKRVTPKSKSKTKVSTRKPSGVKKKSGKGVARKKKSKKKKKAKVTVQISLPALIVAVVIVAVIIGLLLAWQITGFRVFPVVKQQTTTSITVEPGMTARQISKLLEEEGVVANAKDFERYSKNGEIATKLQLGTHTFEPNLSHAEIGEILVSNPSTTAQTIIIYDGYTIDEIDQMLATRNFIQTGDFKQAAKQVAEERGLPFDEGWFLSGTYPLTKDVYALARTMQDALHEVIRPHLVNLEDLDITVAQMVIIASMIQRETNTVAQMPPIAGIIYNRLKANMTLGIDATIRYGLDAWNRALTTKDLNSNNPYNTRKIKGLPPTGIGCPSSAALEAALNPAVHDYFYYLHDATGEIHFAKNYDEHKDNIAKYLPNR